MQDKKPAPQKASSKEQLIAKLIAKAELDFSCCGHAETKRKAN